MVLVHRRPFDVTGFFTEQNGLPEERDLGPILPVEVQFERWLKGQPLGAEIFIDPGADCTLVSHRWIEACWKTTHPTNKPRRPLVDPLGFIRERVSIRIAGRLLDLPASPQLSWQSTAGGKQGELREMAGYEDLLLGRDFLLHHGLLLVIDGGDSFSLLLPDDEDNRRRREEVLGAFRPAR
ncbi:MAG: hypothetical protein ABI193_18445 [Minicystis sp.]